MTRSRGSLEKLRHILAIEDKGGRRAILLDGVNYSLGRDPTNSIILDGESVSRQHAIIMRVPKESGLHRYRLLDGNLAGEPSTNGFTVNGRRCLSHDLEDTDEIVFGGTVKAQYYLRQLNDEEYAKTAESVAMRSIRLEPVSTTSTTLFDDEEP